MSESRLSWHRSFLARSTMAWSFNNCKSQVKQTVTSRKIIRYFLTHCNDPFEPFKKIWFLFFWMLLGSLQINQKISKPFCYGQTNLDEVPNSLYKKHMSGNVCNALRTEGFRLFPWRIFLEQYKSLTTLPRFLS